MIGLYGLLWEKNVGRRIRRAERAEQEALEEAAEAEDEAFSRASRVLKKAQQE